MLQPGSRLRKPIILIGGPSGAGKTELSHRIIANGLPFFDELRGEQTPPIVRHDLKVLPAELPRDQIHIIECATHQFDKMRERYWPQLSRFLQDCELVVHVNLDVAEKVVIRQYFFRMFTGPKRISLMRRLMQLSKYRRLAGYVLTRQLAKASAGWEALGRELAATSVARVTIVRARRHGRDYRLELEAGPAARTEPTAAVTA